MSGSDPAARNATQIGVGAGIGVGARAWQRIGVVGAGAWRTALATGHDGAGGGPDDEAVPVPGPHRARAVVPPG